MKTAESTNRAVPLLGDRYAVMARIGKGGAAGVYLVYDRSLARWRAAKVLHRRYADHEELRVRFLREARTMARLDHPSIVRVIDVADVSPPFMIMEYVEGGNILDWLRENGIMPPVMAVRVVRDLCAALAATHAAGIVHRDVKPHNVLVTADGRCKLTDYGIAKVGPDDPLLELDDHRTDVGAIMGTDAFMSPEQRSDASAVDPRSDIYSAGATLYTLCTRKAVVDLCMLPADSPKLQAVPQALRDIVLVACHLEPSERYQTIEELDRALEALLPELPELSPDLPPLGVRRRELPARPPTEVDPEVYTELSDLLSMDVPADLDADSEFTLGGPSAPADDTDEVEPPAQHDGDPGELGATVPSPPPRRQAPEPVAPEVSTLSPASLVAIAAVLVIGLLLVGGALAARSGAVEIAEARRAMVTARTAWVQDLSREHDTIERLVAAGAARQPLERAWFALQDARDGDRVESAERFWNALVTAGQGVDARTARGILEPLEKSRGEWLAASQAVEQAEQSLSGSIAAGLGMVDEGR